MSEKDTQSTAISQENLEVQFTKTTDRVRHVFGRIEENYAAPFLSFLAVMFRSRPVSTTFACIFLALSFWPVITFLGLVFGGFATILGIGICIALVVYATLFAVTALIFVLVILAILVCSVVLTAVVLFTYAGTHLSFRFYTLVRTDGRDGVTEWMNETKDLAKEYVLQMPASLKAAREDLAPPKAAHEDPATSGSDDVPVIVN